MGLKAIVPGGGSSPAPGVPANYIVYAQDNSGANNATIYVGYAAPGTAFSAAGWSIQQIQYDANGNANYEPWASVSNGAVASNLIWNNRASYTYS